MMGPEGAKKEKVIRGQGEENHCRPVAQCLAILNRHCRQRTSARVHERSSDRIRGLGGSEVGREEGSRRKGDRSTAF